MSGGWRKAGVGAACAGLCLALASPGPAAAGSFVFAGPTYGLDIVTHPPNYTGVGGKVTVSVCVDPGAANAAAMETPVRNIVAVVNGFVPRTPNLLFGANNDIPAGTFDFESLTLHEFGHCLSLAHPNQGVKTGVSGADTNATQSTGGADGMFDFDAGVDGVDGSSDDVRGDDVNLHYFESGVGNPFVLPAKAEAANYTRDVANLPAGHTYPANAARAVGPLVGFPDTESVMQQGQGGDEDQRFLQIDDVATLMFGGTGLDEVAGTADDYTIELVYAGLTTSCDIVATSSTSTSFASCAFGGTFLSANHIAITTGTFRYNPNAVTWYFNPVLACDSLTLDYPHDATIAHTACGDITATAGFAVGPTGTVTLTGASVILSDGSTVTGKLTVISP